MPVYHRISALTSPENIWPAMPSGWEARVLALLFQLQEAQWLNPRRLEHPSNALEIARTVERTGRKPALQGILMLGESVSDETRDLCHKVFGVEPHDSYSTDETGHVALLCPQNRVYHIQSECVYVWDQPALAGMCQRYGLSRPLGRAPRAGFEAGELLAVLDELGERRGELQRNLDQARLWELEVMDGRDAVVDRVRSLLFS